jgi:hypothetical protein
MSNELALMVNLPRVIASIIKNPQAYEQFRAAAERGWVGRRDWAGCIWLGRVGLA